MKLVLYKSKGFSKNKIKSCGERMEDDELEPEEKSKLKRLAIIRKKAKKKIQTGEAEKTKEAQQKATQEYFDDDEKMTTSEALKHPDKLGAGAKKRKKLKKPEDKVGVVMREFKRGTLRSGGSGKKVTDKKQAIAIALSEAGLSNKSLYEDIGKKIFRVSNSLVFFKSGKKGTVGEIREWKGKKFKKVAEGKWQPVTEGKEPTEKPTPEGKPTPAGGGKKPSGGQQVDPKLQQAIDKVISMYKEKIEGKVKQTGEDVAETAAGQFAGEDPAQAGGKIEQAGKAIKESSKAAGEIEKQKAQKTPEGKTEAQKGAEEKSKSGIDTVIKDTRNSIKLLNEGASEQLIDRKLINKMKEKRNKMEPGKKKSEYQVAIDNLENKYNKKYEQKKPEKKEGGQFLTGEEKEKHLKNIAKKMEGKGYKVTDKTPEGYGPEKEKSKDDKKYDREKTKDRIAMIEKNFDATVKKYREGKMSTKEYKTIERDVKNRLKELKSKKPLKKSIAFFNGIRNILQKAREYPIGTIRTWGGKKYQKAVGKWVPVGSKKMDGRSKEKVQEKKISGAEKMIPDNYHKTYAKDIKEINEMIKEGGKLKSKKEYLDRAYNAVSDVLGDDPDMMEQFLTAAEQKHIERDELDSDMIQELYGDKIEKRLKAKYNKINDESIDDYIQEIKYDLNDQVSGEVE